MDAIELKEQSVSLREELDSLAERFSELLDTAVSNAKHHQVLAETFDTIFDLTSAVIGERDGAVSDLMKLETSLKKWYMSSDARVREVVDEVSEETEAETVSRIDESVAGNLIVVGKLDSEDWDAAVMLANAITGIDDFDGMLTELMQDADQRDGVLRVLDKFRAGLAQIEVQESPWE